MNMVPHQRAARALLICAIGVALTVPGPAGGQVDESPEPQGRCAEGLAPYDVLMPDGAGAESEAPAPATLAGKWRRLPRSPFGSFAGIGVWTGEKLLVMDPDTRRVAGYDPEGRGWREYTMPPLPPDALTVEPVWTGTEMLVFTRPDAADRSDGPIVPFVFDPATDAWRELPATPLGTVAGVAAVGDLLVVAGTSAIEASDDEPVAAIALDHVHDCWLDLPDVPGDGGVDGLHAVGGKVLAVTSDNDGPSEVRVAVLDPTTWRWHVAAPSGLESNGDAGVWTGSELVILIRERNDDPSIVDGLLGNAAYEPAADSWRALDPPCRTWTSDAIWTGSLIVDASGKAVDPVSGSCVEMPRRPGRTRSDVLRIWAGDRIIEWAGSDGRTAGGTASGLEYRIRPR